MLGEEFLRGEEEADGWDPTSVRERGRARTDSALAVAGPRVVSGTGPIGSPRALFPVLIYFRFSFLISIFIFYLLHNSFNSIQTKT
jgi:hypothetical protein